MIRNYLWVAIRHLIRHPVHGIVNIAGLALGLASCLFLILFVTDELSHDRQFTDGDRIVRVVTDVIFADGGRFETSRVSPPLGPRLQQDFAGIEAYARIYRREQMITVGGIQFREKEFYIGNGAFLDLFDFSFIHGQRQGALGKPFSLVLTETMAAKYFGSQNPVGQILTLNGEHPMVVTGVVSDPPVNSHITLGLLLSEQSVPLLFGPDTLDGWFAGEWFWTYLLLAPDADRDQLQAIIEDLPEKVMPLEVPGGVKFLVQPLESIHLHSQLLGEFKTNGDITSVYVFSALAGLVLVIACINFMSLSTARATLRAREVALRKVAGATRRQIAHQFLVEALLFALVGLALALILVELLLPWVNGFMGKSLALTYFGDPLFIALAFGLIVIIGLVGGSYPALVLSAFSPQAVLWASRDPSGGAARLRQILVLVQFSASIGLIVATGVVLSQLLYARFLPLGYDIENVVVISGLNRPDVDVNVETLRQRLVSHPGIESVSASSEVPGQIAAISVAQYFPEGGGGADPITLNISSFDSDFIGTYRVPVVAGRAFPRIQGAAPIETRVASDPGFAPPVMINETAARRFGWASPIKAVGKVIRSPFGPQKGVLNAFKVIGVIGDLHLTSVRNAIEPKVYQLSPDLVNFVSVRLTGGDVAEALEHLDQVWEELVPGFALQRVFADDRLEALYMDEDRAAQVFVGFTGLAVFVACLGLFGLAAFTADQRTREIGLRKVMGAQVADIVRLLLWDFSKPVLAANLIAWPVAWYVMADWLSGFAYHIDLGPALFVAAGALALLIAWITVGAHALKAARTNPAITLRYE